MSISVPLPNSAAARTSETIGVFEVCSETLSEWMTSTGDWTAKDLGFGTLSTFVAEHLYRNDRRERLLFFGIDSDWTFLLTDGPAGTDLGVLPSRATRDLGIMAIRAVAAGPDTESFEAALLEVFDPDATDDPQLCLRYVYAVEDGGRWSFGQHGNPLPIEDSEAYARRKIRDRLTPDAVRTLIGRLGAPQVTLETEVFARLVLS